VYGAVDYCCKKTACGFGEWDEVKKQCKELVERSDGTYECKIYKQIIEGKDRTWHLAPAFGAGCCSAFNSDRQAIIRRLQS
jgi:hypothetical protein